MTVATPADGAAAAVPVRPAAAATPRIGLVVVAVAVAAGLAAILLRLLGFDLRKDELLYTAPIALLDHARLYADVFYNHTPGSAWLFYWVGKLLGTGEVLLAGRLAVFAGWVLLGVAAVAIAWRVTRSSAVTAFVAASVLANDLLLSVPGMTATNNLLPIPLAFLGLGLFMTGTMGPRVRPLQVFGAGAALAAAAATKASAGAFVVPVVLAALVIPVGGGILVRLGRVLLPLAAGGLIVAAPVLLLVAEDPATVLGHIVGFHTGPHVAYWTANAALEPNLALTLSDKLRLAYDIWFSGTNLLILAVIATLVAVHLANGWSGVRSLLTVPVVFSGLTFLFVGATTVLPTPSFPQYFAPPLAVAPLVVIALYAALGREDRRRARPAAAAAAVLAILANAPRLAEPLATARDPLSATAFTVHRDGERIAAAIRATDATGPLATLMPLYAYEGGLSTVPELATGEFAYRTVPFMDETLRSKVVSAGPDEIAAVFDRNPPAAFLLGFDERLEAPLLQYARTHGYEPVPDIEVVNRYGRQTLFLRPRDAADAADAAAVRR